MGAPDGPHKSAYRATLVSTLRKSLDDARLGRLATATGDALENYQDAIKSVRVGPSFPAEQHVAVRRAHRKFADGVTALTSKWTSRAGGRAKQEMRTALNAVASDGLAEARLKSSTALASYGSFNRWCGPVALQLAYLV